MEDSEFPIIQISFMEKFIQKKTIVLSEEDKSVQDIFR
jgi:hypothetical protein